jgi:hypothetical protein
VSASQLNRSDLRVRHIGSSTGRAVAGVTSYTSRVHESFGLVAEVGVTRRHFGGPLAL